MGNPQNQDSCRCCKICSRLLGFAFVATGGALAIGHLHVVPERNLRSNFRLYWKTFPKKYGNRRHLGEELLYDVFD